jgi:signal transduction histidine kinase
MGTTGEARDRVINHLFASGLTLGAVLTLPRLDRDVAEGLRDVVERLNTAIDEMRHLAVADLVVDELARTRQLLQVAPSDCVSEPLLQLAAPAFYERALSR